MQQKAADKFVGIQGNDLRLVAVGVIAVTETHLTVALVDQSFVADGGLLGVTAEVVEHRFGFLERGLGVNDPVLLFTAVDEPLNRLGLGLAVRQVDLALGEGLGQGIEKFAPEHP